MGPDLHFTAAAINTEELAMADSPPPLDDVEIAQKEEEVCQDSSEREDEPLFGETLPPEVVTEEQEEPKASLPAPTLETTEEPAVPASQDLVETASSKPMDLFGDDQMEAEVGV